MRLVSTLNPRPCSVLVTSLSCLPTRPEGTAAVSGPLETTTSTVSPQCSSAPGSTEAEMTWPEGTESLNSSVTFAVSFSSVRASFIWSRVSPSTVGI